MLKSEGRNIREVVQVASTPIYLHSEYTNSIHQRNEMSTGGVHDTKYGAEYFFKTSGSFLETACFTATFEILTRFFYKSELVFCYHLLSIDYRFLLNAFHCKSFISTKDRHKAMWHPHCSIERVISNVYNPHTFRQIP